MVKPSLSLDHIAGEFGPKVSALSRRMISNRAVAEEAAQEAWIEICKSWNNFCGGSAAGTWVYTVARRTILRYAAKEGVYGRDELNAYYAENPVDIPGDADPEKEAWVRDSCDRCLTAMLHCLEPEDRRLYLFRDVIHLPYAELSRIFTVDAATLRKRVSRANKKMEAYLTQQCRLLNRNGSCTCTIHRAVDDVDLPAEYDTGIKEKAAEIKRRFGESNALRMKEAFGFTGVEEPFLFSAAMFECAHWEASKEGNTTTIETSTCKFVGICRSIGTSDPCNMYCLEPMYQMVRVVDPNAKITTKKTLWKGDDCCLVEIVQED